MARTVPVDAAAWPDDILDRIPSGVDVSQIDARLRMTPTERLECMRAFLVFLDDAREGRGKANGDRLPRAS
jgi:hypothetical protein